MPKRILVVTVLKHFISFLGSFPFKMVKAFTVGCDSPAEEIPFPWSFTKVHQAVARR